jgi:hypothetical protein
MSIESCSHGSAKLAWQRGMPVGICSWSVCWFVMPSIGHILKYMVYDTLHGARRIKADEHHVGWSRFAYTPQQPGSQGACFCVPVTSFATVATALLAVRTACSRVM